MAALTSALDLVISFATFGAEFAGALGVPTLCFSPRAWAELSSQNEASNSNWQPAIRFISRARGEPWRDVLEEIGRISRAKFSL